MTAALLNHLWQCTLCIGAVWLLNRALRANSARLRYWLWFSASLKFLVPFSWLVGLSAWFASTVPMAPASASVASLGAVLLAASHAGAPFHGADTVSIARPPLHLESGWILLGVWMAGVVLVMLVWTVRWLRLRTLVRSAEPLALAAPVPVLVCPSRLEPGLVGIWHPVLLLPQGLATHLTPAEIEAVLAHEICHLRRRDNLLAALHMMVAALFWFHPLIWWVGARLTEERERACDEAVLASGADCHTYAEGLLKVCHFCLRSPLFCAAGVSGSDLALRVRSIVDDDAVAPLTGARRLGLIVAAAVVLAAPVALGMLPSSAQGTNRTTTNLVPSPVEIAQRLYEQARPRTAVPYDAARFDRFAGYYEYAPADIEHVFRIGAHYQAQATGGPSLEIYPEADSNFFFMVMPAQIDFTVDAGGRVTGLVLHQGGFEEYAPRITESEAKQAEAALQERIMANRPAPGTATFVQHFIDSMERGGTMDPARMAPMLAAATQRERQVSLQVIRRLGPLRAVRFKGVAQNGWDVYDASFAHGELEYRCAPLLPDGRAWGLYYNYLP